MGFKKGWFKVDSKTGEETPAPEIASMFGNLAAMSEITQRIYYASTEREIQEIVRSTPFAVAEMIIKFSGDELKNYYMKYSDEDTLRKLKT